MVWSGPWLLRFGFTDRPGEPAGRWSDAGLQRDDDAAARLAAAIFEGTCPLRPWLKGSAFQQAVWRALLTVPHGGTVSYARLAAMAGHPQAARAVGSAVGANPIAVVVPCHRVVRGDGSPGGYRWGAARKAALLAWEQGWEQPLLMRDSLDGPV